MLGKRLLLRYDYERPVKDVTALQLSLNDQEKILGGIAPRLLRL
jgi:hypothetical protein